MADVVEAPVVAAEDHHMKVKPSSPPIRSDGGYDGRRGSPRGGYGPSIRRNHMMGLNQQNNLAQPQLADQVHQHLQHQQQAISAQQAALQQPAQQQQDLSQPFGVLDNANNQGFMDVVTWAPPPQRPRLEKSIKVYRRGELTRAIDVTRFAGYNELKQDLAKKFGIKEILGDLEVIGSWKLAFIDEEFELVTLGDYSWEKFVDVVRSIKILSPKEVQEMRLEGGEIGNSGIQSEICSN